VGFSVEKVALEQVSSENFGSACQSSFHQMLRTSSSIILGWFNRPIVADVPSGLRLNPHQEKKTDDVGACLLCQCLETAVSFAFTITAFNHYVKILKN
jgi:hypothetical protein